MTGQKISHENPEIQIVETKTIACEGVGGALGHPKVYLTMDASGMVECPYCDRRYILKDGPMDK